MKGELFLPLPEDIMRAAWGQSIRNLAVSLKQFKFYRLLAVD